MNNNTINQQDLNNPVDITEVKLDTLYEAAEHKHDDVEEPNERGKLLDYSQIFQQVYFLGEVPFSSILEGLKEQFQNYINTEDKTNYVRVFYDQLSHSYESIRTDDSEEYPQEATEGLDIIHNTFIDNILHLFESRLYLSIDNAENLSRNDLQFIIQRTYEYFILNAKRNFKTVISSSINGMIPEGIGDDEYFQQLQSLMELFSSVIQNITPVEFIQITGDRDVYELYTNHRITGNFLRKYTPKLYENESFAVEVVNYTTMARLFKEDLKEINNGNSSKL